MKHDNVKPYNANSAKKEQVAEMFDNIAARYDLLNHLLSMGIDITWRKKAVRKLARTAPQTLLDVATGTGDFAIEALSLKPGKITGIDISSEMLRVGRKKVEKKGVSHIIELLQADSENLPFEDNSFDAVTVAFGVRNFENLEKGLREMCRVMKPGGQVAIIEFSHPETFPVKQLYNFYFKTILPTIGKAVSKDSRAYTYLPESVDAFPYGKDFTDIMEKAGYKNPEINPLTFGIASLYIASK